MDPSIQQVIIFHRGIGSTDESASDEEQANKILFYYPEDVPVTQQLSKLTMVEGLIEFNSKFSKDSIETVLMEKHMWSFWECERDIWIIVAIDNYVSDLAAENSGSYRQKPNSSGLLVAIQKMHILYKALFGTLLSALGGCESESGAGWQAIRDVQACRRKIRKLRAQVAQKEQDLECIRAYKDHSSPSRPRTESNISESHSPLMRKSTGSVESWRQSEQLGIRVNTTSIEELDTELRALFQEILECDEKMSELLTQKTCVLRVFVMWYLRTFELSSPSVFSELGGMHYAPDNVADTMLLTRLRSAISSELLDNNKGIVVLYDGHIAWNDLPTSQFYPMYEILRLMEYGALRDLALDIAAATESTSARKNQKAFMFKFNNNASSDLEKQHAHLIRSVEEFSHRNLMSRGYLDSHYSCRDMIQSQEAAVPTLAHIRESSSNGSLSNSAGATSHNDDSIINASDVCALHTVGDLWMPFLHDPESDTQLGRFIIYRHQRYFVLVLLSLEVVNASAMFSTLTNKKPMEECQNNPYLWIAWHLQIILKNSFDHCNHAERYQQALPPVPPPPPQSGLSENIRVLYFNHCNRSMKVMHVGKGRTDPLLSFPSPINSGIFSLRLGAIEQLLSDARCRFAASPSLLAGYLHPHIIIALNTLRRSIACGGVAEACVRISSAQKGGFWALARRFGDREVYFIVDSCRTLNDMLELVSEAKSGFLGSLLL